MKKGCDGEEEKKKTKRIVKIAVHFCHASQPPERRLTGTAIACAKRKLSIGASVSCLIVIIIVKILQCSCLIHPRKMQHFLKLSFIL